MALTEIPNRQLAAALRDGEDASGTELLQLATSKDAKIRESLASRQDAPLSALIQLAQDGKSRVREALAANPAVGGAASVLGILADDKDADVVLALVANPAVPIGTVRSLLNHGKKNVRQAAEARMVAES